MASDPALALQPGLVRRAYGNRTGVGFLGGLALVATAAPRPVWMEVGIGVAVLGVLFRIWASGTLEKNVRVARTGPYRLVRHPLYLGSTILWLGLVSMAGNPWFAVPAALGFVGYHAHAVRREERFLCDRFGDEYRALQREVPALVPWRSFWRLPRALADGGFDAALAFGKHREWHVPLATALLAAALWWFRGAGQPEAARWWTVGALGVVLVGRLALFWALDRDVKNPVARTLIAMVSRQGRRDRAERIRDARDGESVSR